MAEWWSDESLVEALWEEAREGNPKAMAELARKLILEGQYAEGILWFEKASDAGDQDAMFNLGLLYEQGVNGQAPDYEKAYSCFLNASKAKDTEGMYKTAQYLMNGIGVEQDVPAAASLLKRALSLGYLPAQELLYQIPGMREERKAILSKFDPKATKAETLLEEASYDEAITILSELLGECVDSLGEMDAYTIQIMNNLAVALSRAGQYDKSIPLKERVLELRGKSLPLTHPDYITAMTNLTSDYAHVHRYQTALQFSRQAYTAVRESLPICHDLTFLTLNRLSCDLMNLCRHNQALEELKAVTEEVLASCHGADTAIALDYPHWEQTIRLRDLCLKEVKENEIYFSLDESRRNYAYICAELMEMLSALPESYLNKIYEKELLHLSEQAKLAGCYKPRMNQGQAVETDPYTNSLQTLLSYKYLMPGLAECREQGQGFECRVIVSWIQNELCMIATLYPDQSNLPYMEHPQPLDYVKALNAFSDGGERVVSIDSIDLNITQADQIFIIRFAYGSEGSYRVLSMQYNPETNMLDGDKSFILLA